MPQSAHTFTRANTDDEDSARPGTDFVAAVNLHVEPGQVYPATGNVLVPYALPATGTTRALGSFSEGAAGTAIELLYNSAGFHRLVRYDSTGAGTRTTLLEWAGLNFDPTQQVRDGLNGGIIDGLLLYRDAAGEIRCVNLAGATAGGYTPAYLAAEPFALHLLKVPPRQAIAWVRALETSGAFGEGLRVIQSRAYQFAYRYRYVDGEETILSPYSAWADVPGDPASVTFNVLVLALPTDIPQGVTELDILVLQADAPVWQVADTLRRDASGNLPATFRFYGQFNGGAVTEAEAGRLFESLWPCHAGPTLARSRVFVADTLEGYPTPQPAFTAEVTTEDDSTFTSDLKELLVEETAENPQYPGSTETIPHLYYYRLLSGAYPNADSTWQPISAVNVNGQTMYYEGEGIVSYDDAFVNPRPDVNNETHREVSDVFGAQIRRGFQQPGQVTLHADSPYQVSLQFYDALGRPYGACLPKTVLVPARAPADVSLRSISATLTTAGTADLNAEIPEGAYSYQWVLGRCGRTTYFLQGQAADVLGYLGQKILNNPDSGTTSEEENVVDAIHNPHENLLVDIGNFPAVGLGYVFQPGSGAKLRFIKENKEFPIIRQQGDYLVIQWSGYPDQSTDSQGRTRALIEIYEPNLNPSSILYERGPRLAIVRDAQGNRSYAQAVTRLEGDCFLVAISFPEPDRSDPDAVNGTYVPPKKKSYVSAASPIMVESMVPYYRLAPTSTTVTTVYLGHSDGGFFGRLGNGFKTALTLLSGNVGGAIEQAKRDAAIRDERRTTETRADTAARTAANLLWLDMSWGGRPAFVVPPQLQQVRRQIERFSGTKQSGNQLNGLSRWEALNQYDKLPQEQGTVTALVLADQSQTDGSVLLAIQQGGIVSQYLGQQPIRTGANEVLIAEANQVVGGDNTLKGGFGCVDANSIVVNAGRVYYWCRERQDLMRYNNGLVPLGQAYKFRRRLQEAAQLYGDAPVSGCFNPRRQEYWLTFAYVDDDRPGLTLAWSERAGSGQQGGWMDQVSYLPEAGASLGNELLTWQAGQLYRHAPTVPVATFAGVYGQPSVTFTAANPGGSLAKTFQALGVRSQAKWVPTRLTTPGGQLSRILPGWLSFVQGVWRAAVRRDENSPGFALDKAKALHGGRALQDVSLTVTLTCPVENPGPLAGATVDYLINSGQQPNQ